jgi:hypothetical protein
MVGGIWRGMFKGGMGPGIGVWNSGMGLVARTMRFEKPRTG